MSKEKGKPPGPVCKGLALKSILVNKSRPDEQHMLAVARVLLDHPTLWDNTYRDYHFPSKRKEAIASAARVLQVDTELAGELLRRVRSKYYAIASKIKNGRLPETVSGAPCPAWLTLLHKHMYTPEIVDGRIKDVPELVYQKTEQLMTSIATYILAAGCALGRGPHPALERDTGYSSRLLLTMWMKIRALVLEQFAVLCAASDEEGNVPPSARLSPAAWRCLDALLLYELAPAAGHGASQIPYEQTSPLIALFHLVQKHSAEEEPPPVPPGGGEAELERLRKAWNDVHNEYLEQGRTQSLVSLQWRWWWCRAAAAAALARARRLAALHPQERIKQAKVPRPPPLLLAIARRYGHVVTGAPVPWAERVQAGRVFLNDTMYKPREVRHTEPAALLLQPLVASDAEPTPADADDDLILVENEIETIDLDQDQPEPANQSKHLLFDDLPDILTVDPDKAEVRVIFESGSDSDSDSESNDNPKVKLESIDEEITKLNESIQNEILGFFSDNNCELDKETEPSSSAVNQEISLIDTIEEIVVDSDSNETTDPISSKQVENQDKETILVENLNKQIAKLDNASTIEENLIKNKGEKTTQVKNGDKSTVEDEKAILPVEKSITIGAVHNTTLPLDNSENKDNVETDKTASILEPEKTATAVVQENTASAIVPEKTAVTVAPEKDLTSQINEILRSVPRIPHRWEEYPVKHEIDIEEHITKEIVTSMVKSEPLSREVLEYRQNILRSLQGEGEFTMGNEGESVAPDSEPKFDPKLTMMPCVILSDLKHVPTWAQEDETSIDYNILKQDSVYCLTLPVKNIQDNINLTKVVEGINAFVEEPRKFEETKIKDELFEINITVIPAVGPKKYYLNVDRVRSYTTTKLCKNPDFNTRLKRLSDGFFLNESNRELLSQCLPVTIDVQKLSEARTAKLERPGREASKVSLLSIDDVRRINSRILTAEVTPITAARDDEIIVVDSPVTSGGDDSDDAQDRDWRLPSQSGPGRGRGRCSGRGGRGGRPPRGQQLKMRWGPTGPVFTQQMTINNSKYVATGHKKPAMTSLELKRTLRFLEKSSNSGAGGYCCQARRHRAVNDARRRHAARQRRRAPHDTNIHTHTPAECTCCCKRLLSASCAGADAAAAAAASLAALVLAPDAAAFEPDEPAKSAYSETAPQLWDRPRSPSPPASPTRDQNYASQPSKPPPDSLEPTPASSDSEVTSSNPKGSSLTCARVRPRGAAAIHKRRLARKRKERKRQAAEEAAEEAAKEADRKKSKDDYTAWREEREFASKKFGIKPRPLPPPPPPPPKPDLKVDLQAVASQMVVEKPPAAIANQGPVLVSSSSIHVVDLDDDTPPDSPKRKEGTEEMATVVRILENVVNEEHMSGGALLRPNAATEASQTVKPSNVANTSNSNQPKPIKITVKFKEKPKAPVVTKSHIVERQRISVGHISQEIGPRLASILGGHGEFTPENLYGYYAETEVMRGTGEGQVVDLSDDDDVPISQLASSKYAKKSAQASVAEPVKATASVVTTAATDTTKLTTALTVQQGRPVAHCTSLVRGARVMPLGADSWLRAHCPPPPLLEVDIARSILRLGSSAVVASSVAPEGFRAGSLWAPRPPGAPPATLRLTPAQKARITTRENTYQLIKKETKKYVQVLFVLSTAQEVRDLVLEGAKLYIVSTETSVMHPLDTVPTSPSPSSCAAPRPSPAAKRPISLNCVGNRRALAHLVHALNMLSKTNQTQDVISLDDDAQSEKTKKKEKKEEKPVKKDRSLLKPDVKVAVKEAVKEAQKLQPLCLTRETIKAMATLKTLRKLCKLKPICDAKEEGHVRREEAVDNFGEDGELKHEESEDKEKESELEREESRKKRKKGELDSDTMAVEGEKGDEESEKREIESEKKDEGNFWGESDNGESDEDNDEGRLMMDIPDDSTEKAGLNDSNGQHSTDVNEGERAEQAMDIEDAHSSTSVQTEDLGEGMDVEGSDDGDDCILGM